MAFELDFAEERALRELLGRHTVNRSRGPSTELRRAYHAIIDLYVADNSALRQARDEYRQLYREAYRLFQEGEFQLAELMARAVRHLCRAAWYDGKIKYLESHENDFLRVHEVTENDSIEIEKGIEEVVNRLARMKLTGLADRFGGRARKHLERIQDRIRPATLLTDTFMKAAYEYCLATEALHDSEFQREAA